MTNVWKEQVMNCAEAYAKAAQNEAYDKVLNILNSKLNQLDNILDSQEAHNIRRMSKGKSSVRLYDKRYSLRMKLNMVLVILEQVSELRYGKY